MSLKENRVHVVSSCLYLAFAYGLLFWYTSGDFFCERPGMEPGHAIATARLAVACTAWDLGRAYADCWSSRLQINGPQRSTIRIFATILVAGIGFCSIPFWIYRGYGTFLFENSWADVSCVFTEGHGEMFPFVVAPLLTAATLSPELLVRRVKSLGIMAKHVRSIPRSELPRLRDAR